MKISFQFSITYAVKNLFTCKNNITITPPKMEKFSLKWNDYQSNISKSFKLLRDKEDFSDVTLVGEDFKPVTAHKVILSSCSEYFTNILNTNSKHSHPLICLDGVKFKDIQNILDYIYNGELRIYQDEIDRFLIVAQKLKLVGLVGQENSLNEYHTEKIAESSWEESVAELKDLKKTNNIKEDFILSLKNDDLNTIEKLNEKVEESYSKDNSGLFCCLFCSKTAKKINHIRDHVEIHFDGLKLNCNFCGKFYNSRDSLRHHVKRMHS